MMISLHNRRLGLLAALAMITASSGCDERFNPTSGGIRPPPIDVGTTVAGNYDLKEVDGEPLPHLTTGNGVNYLLVSGTFALNADSTWLYSSIENLSGTNGQNLGPQPANYTGTWRVTDNAITLLPKYGSVTVKGDTLFWKGGPRHDWEDPLTFTLVRR